MQPALREIWKYLREHYERLGTASVDDQFDGNRKEHVEQKVTEYRECLDYGRLRFWTGELFCRNLTKTPKN